MICFVDYRITDEEIKNLESLNITPIKVPKSTLLYEAINGHVDIQMALIDKKLILHRDIPLSFLEKLKEYNIDYLLSHNSLDSKYPKDIALNALITKDFLLHKVKFTDKTILDNIGNRLILNVNQGYSNCSVLQISPNAFITSDKKIYLLLLENNFDCLLVPPKDILLPPLEYGFIGGTGGMIDKNRVAFFGSLDFYAYGDLVKDFLKKHNVTPIYLKNGKLSDRGSLLFFDEFY